MDEAQESWQQDASFIRWGLLQPLEAIRRPAFVQDVEKAKDILVESQKEAAGTAQGCVLEEVVRELSNHPMVIDPGQRSRTRFIIRQQWEGKVVEKLGDSILARLTDLTTNEVEEAEILLDEIDEDEHTLIVPGAVFYWTIGYAEDPTRRRTSVFKFRRIPCQWSTQRLTRADEWAEAALRNLIASDGHEDAPPCHGDFPAADDERMPEPPTQDLPHTADS